ncbi:TVP38/TMEM64 family protein [Streptomyces sp. TR06-5]|uniref:TVP38/TMEM64 family protein n=1 Tax=unclassified Streptomyces TaxID=2593676 RepID=UPI0039A13B0C
MSPSVAQPARFSSRLVQRLLSPWSRLGLLLVLLGAAAAAVLIFEPQRLLTDGWPTELSGGLSILLFAGAYGACTTAFVPRPILNLAAGAMFGAQMGVGAAVAGTVLGAGVSFGLGRLLGQDALRPLLRAKLLTAADRQMSRHGFRTMLVMRLLPGIPFAGSNFAASVSRMTWPAFLVGSGLGALPNTAAYVVAGSQADSPSSPAFKVAFAFIALSVVVGIAVAVRKRIRARAEKAAARAQEHLAEAAAEALPEPVAAMSASRAG